MYLVGDILREELRAIPAPSLADQAIAAASELEAAPRAEWPTPAGKWEETVVGLAMAIRRVRGGCGKTRPVATHLVRRALRALLASPAGGNIGRG